MALGLVFVIAQLLSSTSLRTEETIKALRGNVGTTYASLSFHCSWLQSQRAITISGLMLRGIVRGIVVFVAFKSVYRKQDGTLIRRYFCINVGRSDDT